MTTMQQLGAIRIVSLLLGISFISAAIAGIQSVFVSPLPINGTFFYITHSNVYSQLFAIITGLSFILFFVWMSRRLLIAWKLGFILLFGIYLASIWGITADLYLNARIKDFSSVWLPAGICAFAGGWATLG